MSAEFTDAALAQIRDVAYRLQNVIPDYPTLLQLLSAPLACVGLLPPRFQQYNVSPLPAENFSIHRHIPPLQRALLEHVIQAWEPVLVQEDSYGLLEQYFCPDIFFFASPAAGQIAIHAYSSILSLPLTDHSIRLLVKLSQSYPIDVLHSLVFSDENKGSSGKQTITWEDCVRDIVAIPAKVANFMKGRAETPQELEQGAYFNKVSARCEVLVAKLCVKPCQENVSSVTYLLSKLVTVGVFVAFHPNSPSQPSFFQATLPTIRTRLHACDCPSYADFWSKVLYSLPSSFVLRTILTSLFSSLDLPSPSLDPTTKSRSLVKREARLLKGLLGILSEDNGDLLDGLNAITLGREWSEGHARIFVCWAASVGGEQTSPKGLEVLLERVVDMWTTPDHIRHSLLSRHHYVTALLLLLVASFNGSNTNPSSVIHALALSPSFISSISTYISHMDSSVRRCGMLVAEEVARASAKKLDFGDWDGAGQGREWCREIRDLMKERDVDVDDDVEEEAGYTPPTLASPINALPQVDSKQPSRPIIQEVGYDSDDSLTGYTSPSSSRSPSPTPSELEEVAKDPTIHVGRKKVVRPVYLSQLGEMVRSTSGLQPDQEEPQKIQVALDVAEELIRRKRAYGSELEENAVNLAYGFVVLQDNFDLELFEEKRQAALVALVACCPRRTAPAIIEEFFRNQYSVDQRYVILNALALGARELAGFPTLVSAALPPTPADRVWFPSKRLPPALHQKYFTVVDQNNLGDPVQRLLENISREAIESSKEPATDKVPQLVRERHLRVRKPAKVTEVSSSGSSVLSTPLAARPPTTFTDVAAECFICPLITRFWLFLRDEQAREARTAHHPARDRYSGTGTGLVLNVIVVSRFLGALAVMVHAARNAPEWLAVIAPDALELAVTLGTRPLSANEGENEDLDSASDPSEGGKGKEAAVLTTALELSLVVLDGCLDLDGGRSMGLEHTALLLGTAEWAAEVLSKLEKGTRVLGGGGIQEVQLRRAAAGVVLKADELTSRWRRSMVDIAA